MLQTVHEPRVTKPPATSRETCLAAFRFMLLARVLDDKFAALYRAGKIHGGVFLGRGQEALSAAVGLSLKKSDVFAPLIRDAAGRLAFGEPVIDAVRTYLGSALGPMRGRDGNVHRGRPQEGYLPMVSHLGAMISVVNGVLFARKLKNIPGTVGAACIGDGATSTGSFHEALNQAAVEKLPLVLVVANNQYAYSTPTSLQFACRDLADKAVGYGVESQSLDGTDLAACLEIIGAAVARAREGRGPQLVIATLLRLCGHGEHDDAGYVDPKLKSSPIGRDCLKVAEEFLLRQKWMDATQLAALRNQLVHEVEEAVAQVQREPTPDPFTEEWRAIASKHLSETHVANGD
jgi:pyruvate dehydrogenase E1 component alpha subunit/2-oxoisovalerate dehydrogenase E1 component alpha subunit